MSIGAGKSRRSHTDAGANDETTEIVDALDGIDVQALELVDASILRGKIRGGITISTESSTPPGTSDAADDDETIAARVPRELAERIKRAAREDDRTVSHWIRRHFKDYFQWQERGADGSAR
jgi:hypothetical protein